MYEFSRCDCSMDGCDNKVYNHVCDEHIKNPQCDVDDCVKPVVRQVCSNHSINPDVAEEFDQFEKYVVFGVNIGGGITSISVLDDSGEVGNFGVNMINEEAEAWKYAKGLVDKYFDRFNLR